MKSYKKRKQSWRQKYKKEYKNPYFKKTRPRNRRLIASFILLGLTALGWLYLFYFSPYFIIKHVSITGLVEIPENDFRELVNGYFNEKKLLIFKNNNIFTCNEVGLQQHVTGQYSFENIIVKKEYPNRVYVEVTEKASSFIWSENDKEFLVDKAGEVVKKYLPKYDYLNLPRIFGPYDVITEEILDQEMVIIAEDALVDLPESEDAASKKEESEELSKDSVEEEEVIEPKEYQISQRVISSEKASFALKLYEYLKDVEGIKFSFYEMPSLKSSQLNAVFDSGLKIYFNMDKEPEHQNNTLMFLRNGELKNKINTLKYIDLRFGDRVYYK